MCESFFFFFFFSEIIVQYNFFFCCCWRSLLADWSWRSLLADWSGRPLLADWSGRPLLADWSWRPLLADFFFFLVVFCWRSLLAEFFFLLLALAARWQKFAVAARWLSFFFFVGARCLLLDDFFFLFLYTILVPRGTQHSVFLRSADFVWHQCNFGSENGFLAVKLKNFSKASCLKHSLSVSCVANRHCLL